MTTPPFKAQAPLVVLAIAAVSLPGLAWSQGAPAQSAGNAAPKAATVPPSTFKCESGRELQAEFVNRDAQLVAIVDAGDGPHVLALKPWTGGLPQITWSDGQRTLTWSAGVQLHFMDGATHRNCGRGGHSH